MTWRGSTKRLSRPLLALLAPLVTLLLRVPPMLARDGPFGYDPYIHLYFVKAWSRYASWPVLNDAAEVLPHDYDAWPGAHILAASVSAFGAAPIGVLTYAPLLLLFLTDLVIVLLLLRRTDLATATVGGVLFGLLDFLFFQTQWYIPELVGLLLVATLLLNELSLRRHLVSLLLLLAALVTHHLTFFIAVIFWVVLGRGRPDRAQLVMASILAVATYLFWGLALESTGSFPDIRNQLGGVHPALVLVGAMAGLMALRWGLALLVERGVRVPEDGTILDLFGERWRRPMTAAMVAAVAATVGVILLVYMPSLSRADGIGVQPSKVLMLAGGALFVACAPVERGTFRVLCLFGLAVGLFAINPVLFDFIPLDIRFLEFAYIPGILLLSVGAFHLGLAHPERARAVLLALLLVCPVLYTDDALRYGSEESQRFAHSSEDLEFAKMAGGATEANATVVTPFGLAPLVFGISERRTATHPVRAALDGDGYVDALPYLEELAERSPVYLVHSSDHLRYLETENDHFTEDDLRDLSASLDLVSGRLELVLDDGAARMYRFQ